MAWSINTRVGWVDVNALLQKDAAVSNPMFIFVQGFLQYVIGIRNNNELSPCKILIYTVSNSD